MAENTQSLFALSNLRFDSNRPEIFTITSGKGGVGKTNFSINMALLLKRLKKNVLLVDADIHLGNVDLLLGLRPKLTLSEVLSGEHKLSEIIMKGPTGLDVLPASSAVLDMLELDDKIIKRLSDAFKGFDHSYDIVVVDTGAGIGKSVTSFVFGADKIVVVVTPDPASIADAYGVIKVTTIKSPNTAILMVVNMADSNEEGENIFKKMELMIKRFLDVKIYFGGVILRDSLIRECVQLQSPLIMEYPTSKPSNAMKLATRNLLKLPLQDSSERKSLFDGFRQNRMMEIE